MATPPRTDERALHEVCQVLNAVGSVLHLVDEQWDRLDEHQRRNAVRLSLDTVRSYASSSRAAEPESAGASKDPPAAPSRWSNP